MKKRIAIITIGIIVILLGVFIWFTGAYMLLFVNHVHYGTNESIVSVIIEGMDKADMQSKNFIIKYPLFQGSSTPNYEKFTEIYYELQSPGAEYAYKIATEYENYATLDYKTEIIKNKSFTISFFGYGYPNKGAGKPITLDKDFIFDISKVNEGDFPKLINKSITTDEPLLENFKYCDGNYNEVSVGEYTFYINTDDSDRRLYRCDINGDERLIFDDIVYYVYKVDNSVYFSLWYKQVGGCIFRLTDTDDYTMAEKVSDEGCFFWLPIDDYIYYLKPMGRPEQYDDLGLFRMDLDGKNITLITDKENITSFYADGENVYITVADELFEVAGNGEQLISKIMPVKHYSSMYAKNGWIYILGIDGCYYAVKSDGTEVLHFETETTSYTENETQKFIDSISYHDYFIYNENVYVNINENNTWVLETIKESYGDIYLKSDLFGEITNNDGTELSGFATVLPVGTKIYEYYVSDDILLAEYNDELIIYVIDDDSIGFAHLSPVISELYRDYAFFDGIVYANVENNPSWNKYNYTKDDYFNEVSYNSDERNILKMDNGTANVLPIGTKFFTTVENKTIILAEVDGRLIPYLEIVEG